jgi:hypothetical protein
MRNDTESYVKGHCRLHTDRQLLLVKKFANKGYECTGSDGLLKEGLNFVFPSLPTRDYTKQERIETHQRKNSLTSIRNRLTGAGYVDEAVLKCSPSFVAIGTSCCY